MVVVLVIHQGRVVVRGVVGGGVHHHVCVERWVVVRGVVVRGVVVRRVVVAKDGRSCSSVVLRTVVGAWVGRVGGLVGAAPKKENPLLFTIQPSYSRNFHRYISTELQPR